MLVEEWRDLPGCEGYFQVSSFGRARSLPRQVFYKDGRVGNFLGKIKVDSRGNSGYRQIDLGRKNGGRMTLHKAVALAFLEEKPDWSECINHIDGDKNNNRPDNLEWSTYALNNKHARENGLQNQHGENCNLTKYGDQLVLAMRRVHAKYSPTYRELADLFDVSQTMAAQVVKGDTRKK
jgi:hypothetical protein